jgi:transposase
MATGTVLSGPERRRRWASSEKAGIVEESLRPGAVVTVVARRHDVHPNLLHHWRRQAKQALVGGEGLKFLPVAVTPSVRPESTAASLIEIELGGARVRVDAAVDEAALGRVLRALGAKGR